MNARAAAPHLAPVAAGERIVALDVVRGVALLGILLMNVEFFSRPIADLESGMAAGLHGADLWIAWFVHVFVRGKFWTMFSLLFGMGFALMLLRADAKGAPFGWPYLRRTLVLALLGAAHYLLLWAGDILFAYAMGALLLLVALVAGLRRMPPARMAKVGLAIYLLPFVLMMVGGANMLVAQPEPPSAEQAQELAQRVQEHEVRVAGEARVMAGGSHADAVALRVDGLPKFIGIGVGFGVIVAGVFLVGAWFVRSGAMLDPAAHLPMFRRMAGWGLPVGLGLSVVAALVATRAVPGQNDAEFLFASGLAAVAALPASVGYIGAVVVGLHGRARRWLAWFAPAGRMALSNYLAQSLLGTLFFYGYGLGQWGMSRSGQLVFVLALFGAQMLFSRWWLSRFRFGPLEWLWRAATYGRWPPLHLH
ncbi:DUF418 domain-containing protein [Luteimonas sp. 8-5]|uniref:DUF418 domain-containing protein n=1 Tax=Luteimonas sp. 8-5 TaxID=3039387 RepID=UPI0024366C40|nr:DUF418 domain-containing protein [Luteimonas sp. 8-5]MDG6347159.1 DUF418 domain-containing protein [Luteimonas sp. 8-5]